MEDQEGDQNDKVEIGIVIVAFMALARAWRHLLGRDCEPTKEIRMAL
jgi:hypothetical protein